MLIYSVFLPFKEHRRVLPKFMGLNPPVWEQLSMQILVVEHLEAYKHQM